MSKVALTSDNHFDINKIDSDEMLKSQAEYLNTLGIAFYIIAGDLFNDFQRSQDYVTKLQAELGTSTRVLFIAGNHDMLKNVTFDELEAIQDTNYVHNRAIDLPGNNWQLIFNNGWYDYSYRPEEATIDEAALWKRAYWVDAQIKQPMSDLERMQIVLLQSQELITKAKAAGKHVLYVTHFNPKANYITVKPGVRMWNMANAMMGSRRLGDLLQQLKVERVQFGHMHIHPKPLTDAGTTYYNQSVGYRNNHINEWIADDFLSQWQQRLRVIELL